MTGLNFTVIHVLDSGESTTPPLRGTPPQEGNGAQNSPPVEGWQAQPDGVV
ncbi:MAG: hypothetical protein K0A93_05925 [Desulfuromonadaceae bacterium]|nr:hypothetical protein [Desulfuromonadaceae bacterium]